MSSGNRATLEQMRALHAWERVAAVKRARAKGTNGDAQAQEYGREAKRLPVRILNSGLGHALAFLRARHRADGLLRDLDDWVLERRRLPGVPPGASSLTEAICKGDSDFLQLATDEALAYLQWLTRFAEAEIGISED